MKTKYLIIGIFLLGGCKDKYIPKLKVQINGNLVVDGFINAGTGPTSFRLSRTTSLDSPKIVPELHAQVEIQSENGAVYPLSDLDSGWYTIDQGPTDPSQTYRIHIKTSDGKDYLSDLAPVTVTPPIDTVSWTASPSQVSLSVSTHNGNDQSRYYEWKFDETWQYNAKYSAGYEYVNHQIITRPAADNNYTCWRSDSSTDIIIASSDKLNDNVISAFPLTVIPYNSTDKLIVKYSILVKQYALTKDWYEWIQKIKRNTEELGSIFDAQPSELTGNIHCTTNPDEPVVGYVGCSTETLKRIFISHADDIPTAAINDGYGLCIEQLIGIDPAVVESYLGQYIYLPLNLVEDNTGAVVGVNIAGYDCADCRARGGVTTKPDFWQ